ncbi:hypothetical protein [Chryseobacterium sp. 5_R23647]|uniref:hypothetical protein n=1 Tax=Chryseobacterium sp. 5_R23647 TaxID=2258964 RepID=UPI000E228C8E|nr:hypothetical protein [Chryseobacterium sp. 5_R23647]REC46039.1 hypothetical protein DRF69_02720 [Chryseobacterium sp. 5_R23647]
MKLKEELKKLFENGDKPTQENFWEWQDSYWHKDEKLPTDNAGLYKIKGSVADKTALDALTGMSEGDVYNLLDTGANYVYVLDLNNTGIAGWDDFFGTVDLSSINLQTVLDNGGTANFSNEFQTAFYSMTQGGFQAQTRNQSGNGSIGLQSTGQFTMTRNSIMVNMTDNGLTYQQDYSTDFVDRSLVDKAYVDSKVSPATLQTVLNNGGLASDSDSSSLFRFDLINKVFATSQIDGAKSSMLELTPSQIFINHDSDNGYSTSVEIRDNALDYGADYSDRFTDRSLVDKRYVDNAIFQATFPPATLQTILENGGTASFNNGIQEAFYAMTQGGFQAQTRNQSGNGSFGLQNTGQFHIGRNGKMVNMTDNGLTYGQDYSADFVDRSLVDKGYVDNAIFQSTPNLSLTDVINNGDRATNPEGNNSIQLSTEQGQVNFNFIRDDIGYTAFHQFGIHGVSGSFNSPNYMVGQQVDASGGEVSFSVTDRQADVKSAITLKPNSALAYQEDYSSKFTDRSLVDKGYVNNKIKASKGYKNLTALLQFTNGTFEPTFLELENNIGNIVWKRTGIGEYVGTLSGAFINNRTWTMAQINSQDGGVPFGCRVGRLTDDQLFLSIFRIAEGNPTNIAGTCGSLEIKIY